jgi:hypothetical protein
VYTVSLQVLARGFPSGISLRYSFAGKQGEFNLVKIVLAQILFGALNSRSVIGCENTERQLLLVILILCAHFEENYCERIRTHLVHNLLFWWATSLSHTALQRGRTGSTQQPHRLHAAATQAPRSSHTGSTQHQL